MGIVGLPFAVMALYFPPWLNYLIYLGCLPLGFLVSIGLYLAAVRIQEAEDDLLFMTALFLLWFVTPMIFVCAFFYLMHETVISEM